MLVGKAATVSGKRTKEDPKEQQDKTKR